jgi:hypothetical protein
MTDSTFYSDMYHEMVTLEEMTVRMHTYLPRANDSEIQVIQDILNQITLAGNKLEQLIAESVC